MMFTFPNSSMSTAPFFRCWQLFSSRCQEIQRHLRTLRFSRSPQFWTTRICSTASHIIHSKPF
jgi:hypothetical protein